MYSSVFLAQPEQGCSFEGGMKSCSLVVFEPEELGKALSPDKLPAHVAAHLPSVVAQAAALSATTSSQAAAATPSAAPAAMQQRSLEQPAEQSTGARGSVQEIQTPLSIW